MQNRIIAGSARALALVAIVGLILLPALDASAAATGKSPASGLTGFPSSRVNALEADSIEPMALYPRANYTWQYATGPVYGEVEASRESDAGVIRLDVGSFDLSRGTPAIPFELQTTAKFDRPGGQYFILAFRADSAKNGSLDRIREAIVGQGGAVVVELGPSAYVVRINAASHATLASMNGVAALEPYHPAFKLSPTIGRSPLQDPVQALSDVFDLDVLIFPGEDVAAISQAIRNLGGNVTATDPGLVRAEMHREKLERLAGIEGVSKIFEHLPVYPLGSETTAVMQTGRWNGGALPYHSAGVNGGGRSGTCSVSTTIRCQGAIDCPGAETCNNLGPAQVLMIIDSGIQLDAGDLSNTRVDAGAAGAGHRKVKKYATAILGSGDLLGCDDPAQGGFTHGHVVAATALGNATVVPIDYGAGWVKLDVNNVAWPMDGVAPRAILAAYDAGATPLQGSCTNPLNSGLNVGNIYVGNGTGGLEVGYTTDGAKTFNFSWGSTNNPTYGANATKVDTFLNDGAHNDAMIFIAAGNDGKDPLAHGYPDPLSVSDPATAKNAVVVGASGNTSEPFNDANEQDRFAASSAGPATAGSLRVAPLLMAPGTDFGAIGGNMGFDGEFACRSNDNTQANPVECDVVQSASGTSFAAPAAAGAALLVRDWFAQGFYPDGTSANPSNGGDVVTVLSGALVKAALVASADWMDASTPAVFSNAPGANMHFNYRFNNEQGYGRVQLNNVLPLQTFNPTPVGILISDGGIASGRLDISGLTADINTGLAETDTGTFTVCDDSKELRVSLVWMDSPSADGIGALNRNLDLELTAPVSGKVYYGNHFTDAADSNTSCDNTGITGGLPGLDESPWSLPNCGSAVAVRDNANPTEAVFLSPDARGDGSVTVADKQTEAGVWTIRVRTGAASQAATVGYAVVVSGGVCGGSSVQLDRGSYKCNQPATVIVNERAESNDALDPVAGLTDTEIRNRTTIQVVAADGTVIDTEGGTCVPPLTFTHVGLKFTSNAITVTDGTVAESCNGCLDVRDGNSIVVIYADKTSGTADANKRRTSRSSVDCTPAVGNGGLTFGQFGLDTAQVIDGGSERDARGLFTYGYPDRYMDSGEQISFRIAFQSSETEDLTDVLASLRCVLCDADSPAECQPGTGTTQCADPNRLNNLPCTSFMTILDSPKVLGDVPAGEISTPSFSIQMCTFSGMQCVDMLLGISAAKSGRTVESLIVSRNTLNADQLSFFYSTDFPTGGVENRDYALTDEGNGPSNEVLDNPTTRPGDFSADYRFDTITWSNLRATGRNGLINPWNFEANNGFFTVGLNNTTTTPLGETIANWGEDKNFNGVLDWNCSLATTTACPGAFPPAACGRCSNNVNIICSGSNIVCGGGGTTCNADAALGTCVSSEDRLPQDGILENNWGTAGGCGWQTNGTAGNPLIPGGVWHTGQISTAGANPCLFIPGGAGACAQYGTIVGTNNIKNEWEMLLTPPFQKVNQCNTDIGPLPANCNGVLDVPGQKVFEVEFMDWAWNMAVDLKDRWAQLRWEFDTDTTTIAPVDLFNDATVLNAFGGNLGAISNGNSPLFDGFPVFAPFVGNTSQNGSVGNNRVGRNPCFFEVNPRPLPVFHFPDPPDDDINNDGDGTTDEFVTPNGPIRNFNMQQVNGPDMRFNTFEDIYGPSGASFQGAVGLRVFEATAATGDAQTSFGAAVDDMVVQWREYKLVEDATDPVTSGACAAVEIETGNTFEGNGSLMVTVTDPSPYGCTAPDKKNDCNFDGDFTDAGNCKNPITNTGSNTVCTDNTTCGVVGEYCVGADDDDCDNNGVSDVVVRVFANSGPDVNPGERITLNRVGASAVYKGAIPTSTSINAGGVLFVQDGGPNNAEGIVRYNDRWDGSAACTPCQSDSDSQNWGIVTANINVGSVAGNITVRSFQISDGSGSGSPPCPAGQDGDGYPDTNETVDMFITVSNKTGTALTNVQAFLATNDPKIDGLLKSAIVIGSIPANSVTTSVDAFRFHVSPAADRSGVNPVVACTAGSCTNFAGSCAIAGDCVRSVNQDYSAAFTITLAATQFDINATPQGLVADIDLNSQNAVASTTTFTEGFESGFTNFVLLNLDDSIASNTLSNGKRCQYNDPEFVGSNSYGATECYLGFVLGQPIVNDWKIYDTTQPDGGRAYLGVRSLWYGISTPGNPGASTYGLSQMDAVRTKNPLNLAARVCSALQAGVVKSCNSGADCTTPVSTCVSANPELTFKQQISTTDNRSTNTPNGQAADRGVVQAQLNAAGAVWQKITPYENVYDAQGTDNFSNCLFDPDDDGNNEDSYFDPGDPDRRLGPSSTCFPEFVFSYMGDTDTAFEVTNIGRASDGPGLQGSLGIGTWVESKADMSRYRGRAIRIRYLITTIKVSDTATLEAVFHWNPNAGDDGWFIDDVRLTQTTGLSTPTVRLDTIDNSGLPGGTPPCTTASLALTVTPSTSPSPGALVTLTANPVTFTACVNGTPLVRFWLDADNNCTVNSAPDTLLQDWTVNPTYPVAPTATTNYIVEARCSTAPLGPCNSVKDCKTVTVACHGGTPSSYHPQAWWAQLLWPNKTTYTLPPSNEIVDVGKGTLSALRALAYPSTYTTSCAVENSSATSFPEPLNPDLRLGCSNDFARTCTTAADCAANPAFGCRNSWTRACLPSDPQPAACGGTGAAFTCDPIPAVTCVANAPQSFYYVARGQDNLCNENKKYTTYSSKETPRFCTGGTPIVPFGRICGTTADCTAAFPLSPGTTCLPGLPDRRDDGTNGIISCGN